MWNRKPRFKACEHLLINFYTHADRLNILLVLQVRGLLELLLVRIPKY